MNIAQRRKLLEVLLVLWLILAQLWYYRQFAGLFRAAVSPIFHGLWR